MSYDFQPARFAALLFGLTIVMALISGVIQIVTGLTVPVAGNAILPIMAVVGMEGRRFGLTMGRGPTREEAWPLAVQMAIWGTVIYAIFSLLGVVLMAGIPSLGNIGVLLTIAGSVAVLGGVFLVMGLTLFGAVAKRQGTA